MRVTRSDCGGCPCDTTGVWVVCGCGPVCVVGAVRLRWVPLCVWWGVVRRWEQRACE